MEDRYKKQWYNYPTTLNAVVFYDRLFCNGYPLEFLTDRRRKSLQRIIRWKPVRISNGCPSQSSRHVCNGLALQIVTDVRYKANGWSTWPFVTDGHYKSRYKLQRLCIRHKTVTNSNEFVTYTSVTHFFDGMFKFRCKGSATTRSVAKSVAISVFSCSDNSSAEV